MRILVGTLYTIENEREQCAASLQQQEHTGFEQIVLENLPNKIAHDSLYQLFMEQSASYDLFLKLDADMVLADKHTLSWIVGFFRADPELDHLLFPVHDWFSDTQIMGLSTFSKRLVWRSVDHQLTVDRAWTVPGRRQIVEGKNVPLVLHSPDPSPVQAFRFGLHRALKAVQPGVKPLSTGQLNFQWRLLKQVWEHFLREKDPRLGLAIMGAESVLRGEIDIAEYSRPTDRFYEAFHAVEHLSANELYDLSHGTWGRRLVREARLRLKVGPRFYWRQWKEIPEFAAAARLLGRTAANPAKQEGVE